MIELLHKAAKEHGIGITSVTKKEEDAYEKDRHLIMYQIIFHLLGTTILIYNQVQKINQKRRANLAFNGVFTSKKTTCKRFELIKGLT